MELSSAPPASCGSGWKTEDLPADAAEALLVAGALVALALAALSAAFYRSGTPPAMAITIADQVLAPFGGRFLVYETERIPC